jgi:leucyl aminopeptidase
MSKASTESRGKTKVAVKSGQPGSDKQDALAVLLHEGEELPAALDALCGGQGKRSISLGDFKGKLRQRAVLYANGGGKVSRLLLIGLGNSKTSSLERTRRAAGTAVQEARRLRAKRLGIVVPEPASRGGPGADDLAAACAEAVVLANYAFDYKSASQAKPSALSVTLFAPRSAVKAVERAVHLAESTNLARDLANAVGNHGTPTHLAQTATKLGAKHGFKVKVLGQAEMKKLGMGALLGVAKGSSEPPKFIVMDYAPKGHAKDDPVCLVGKGLTFDSGGISLKPADKMWEMKFDKCGGCAVIGAMVAVARNKLPMRVVGLVPSTENMPGGGANKPGDVLTALNGKTIEVLNTDAEGRLILADALSYAARYKPSVILDMATLTGSVVVALGDVRAAVMTPDDELAGELKLAGERSGELVWPLPMDDAYGEHVKSEVADVKNLGRGREAGSIAGGWFLRHFVPKDVPWAHLDIAGTAWHSSDPGRGYLGRGASGFGVRLAYEFIRARSEA